MKFEHKGLLLNCLYFIFEFSVYHENIVKILRDLRDLISVGERNENFF